MKETILFCVNFKALKSLNNLIGNIDNVILYSTIAYHVKTSAFSDAGGKYIIRTRDSFSQQIGRSVRRITNGLQSLNSKGLISYNRTSAGTKNALIIRDVFSYPPAVNVKYFSQLSKYTGCNMMAVLIAYLFYSKKDGKSSLHKNTIADLLCVSERTVRNLISCLHRFGFDVKKDDDYQNPTYYVLDNNGVYDKICTGCSRNDLENSAAYLENPAADLENSAVHPPFTPYINNRVNISKNNSKVDQIMDSTHSVQTKKKLYENPVVNFSYNITEDDKKYIRAAVKNTLDRNPNNTLSLDSICEQVFYYLCMPAVYKSTDSLKHAINRAMRIIRDGKWMIPYGYYKYSDTGRQEKAWFEYHESENKRREDENKARHGDNCEGVMQPERSGMKSVAELANKFLKMTSPE